MTHLKTFKIKNLINNNNNIKLFSIISIVLSLFHINFGGKLFYFDLLSFCTLIYIILNLNRFSFIRKLFEKNRILVVMILILITNQLLQDSINDTNFISFIKGSLKFINLLGCTLFLLIIYNKLNIKNLNNFLLIPLTTALFLIYIFQPNIHAIDGDFWKFGIGYPTVLLLFLIIRNNNLLLFFSILLFFVSVYFNSKSLALIILILILYNITKRFQFISRYIALLICITFSVLVFNKLNSNLLEFSHFIKQNTFVLKNLDKTENQTSSNLVQKIDIKNVNIKTGRSDFFEGLYYIKINLPKSIFIGTGTINKSEIITVKTHSHIIGDTVEYGGILFFIWLYAILFIGYTLYIYLKDRNLFDDDILILVSLLLCWDILFSPFSGDHRFISLIYFMFIYFNFKKLKCVQ